MANLSSSHSSLSTLYTKHTKLFVLPMDAIRTVNQFGPTLQTQSIRRVSLECRAKWVRPEPWLTGKPFVVAVKMRHSDLLLQGA